MLNEYNWDGIDDYLKRLKDINSSDLYKEYLGNFESSNCLHKQCSQCGGTGTKLNGRDCIHYISCSCEKCSTR